ncbi:MAG: AMP-binding protein, partial [Gammaproteobacteria bacterium]|nr:AMP-binding protein [Gammaproteobacteria bacterium]
MAAVTERSQRTLRLTRGQQLIWAGQQLHPDVPLYNMAFLFTIDGPLEPELFRQAFAELLRRCDALRTTVISVDGEPRQQVWTAGGDAPVDGHQALDFSSEPDPDAAAQAWADERCARAFDMERRLYDSALLKLSLRRCAWFFNQHHIVCDAWSVAILFEQLGDIYAALAAGDRPPPVALPAYESYVDFEADPEPRQAATAYWEDVAARAPAPAPMYGRSMVRAPGTDSVRTAFELGAGRSARLAELARAPGVRTLSGDLATFNLFATVLLAFLHRVSGQHELAVGAPAHNRPTADFKQTTGLFTEVYPLNVRVDADDSFMSLYQRVLEKSFDFLKHAMPGAGSPGGNAGCNTVLNVLTATFTRFAGLPVRALWLHPGHKDREHHLRLQVHDFSASGSPALYFDFNAGVLDAGQRAAAVEHFVRLLDAMLEDPSRPIGEVDLLTGEERENQVEIFNATGQAQADSDNVLARFEALAASQGDRPALVAGERTVSYAELNFLAHSLAGRLREQVADDSGIVGVCTWRSVESVVGFLAVLKAGRTFLSLDPAWPADRIAMVLDDAAVATVLMQPELSVPLPAGVRTLAIDAGPVSEPAAVPASAGALRPELLAYVLYTSGSTGRPKGVMIPH